MKLLHCMHFCPYIKHLLSLDAFDGNWEFGVSNIRQTIKVKK